MLANLYSDLAPWIDRETRVSASQMRDTINYVAAHRGKWDSWVTDTMTPVLIVGNEIFLPLGPPVKDPTNYFWTVLQDLQALVQRHKVADVEFLLNMADTPVVFAQDDGKPSVPIPIFSYCKTRRFLDILIPGYYSPDRTCKQFTETYNAKYPWRAKREALFADLRSRGASGGCRAVIFTEFRDVHTEIVAQLRSRYPSWTIFEFSGSTGASSRHTAIRKFQASDHGNKVFVITMRAGNVGITLTAADVVYLLGPCVDPGDEVQAAGRIHRLGQTRRVLLKKFIMKGTVEEAIEEFHSKLKTGVFKFSSGSMPKAAALLLCSK